jgi:hypothetical protein
MGKSLSNTTFLYLLTFHPFFYTLRSPKTNFYQVAEKGHLLRFPHPSSLRRTAKYASLLRISGALHLALFEQPGEATFSAVC